jgi:hypothetical protein
MKVYNGNYFTLANMFNLVILEFFMPSRIFSPSIALQGMMTLIKDFACTTLY